MDNWIIINKIKNGTIRYSVGDEVIIFRRKGKYPSQIKDNTIYIIHTVENDFITVHKKSDNEYRWSQPIKVHKTYMLHPGELRNIKLEILLR